MNRIGIASLLLVSLCFCSSVGEDSTQHSFRTYVENGVTIAETHGGPKYPEAIFQFDEVMELREDESQPASLINTASEILRDEAGCFYVIDNGDRRIIVFGPDGTYLRTFGREGSGPGEFRQLRALWLRDGELALYDYGLQRTSVFSTAGVLQTTHAHGSASTLRIIGMGMIQELYPLADGTRLIRCIDSRDFTSEQSAMRYSAVIIGVDGDTLTTFATNWFDTPQHPSRSGGYISDLILYASIPCLQYHSERGILIADSAVPELHWYSLDGSPESTIRLGLDPEPVTAAEREAIRRRFRELIERTDDPDAQERWEHTIIPEFKSLWDDLIVDDFSFYWLRDQQWDWSLENPSDTPWTFRIYSPEGEYLGSATWPVHVASLTRSHLIGRQRVESTGGYRYVVYRIVPAVAGLDYR